jgi:tripartite-type tricarboxylate transporter receptor subunit TctC
LKGFDAVTQIASAPLVVVVPESSPIKTFRDLLDAARKAPGKLTYGSAGNGSASHLATVLLNVVANLDTMHVPYRGAGPAIIDLLGGQTQFMVTTIPSVIGMIDTGKLRALAVTSEQRTPFLRDVATIAESGLPDYQASAWYGFVVPTGTPPVIIETLRKSAVATLSEERVRSRLASDGAQPVGNSPAEFSSFIKAEHARWKEIIAKAKIEIL